jgi:hypothetical protein
MKYLFGETPSRLNIALMLLFMIGGIVFTFVFLDAPLLMQIIASIIVADIFAGAYSNITKSTNEFYYGEYLKNKIYSPIYFTLLHALHIGGLILLIPGDYSIIIVAFDFVVIGLISLLKIDYKYHSLLIIISVIPGLIGYEFYGFFWSGVMVMFALKSIAGYKLGLTRVAIKLAKSNNE